VLGVLALGQTAHLGIKEAGQSIRYRVHSFVDEMIETCKALTWPWRVIYVSGIIIIVGLSMTVLIVIPGAFIVLLVSWLFTEITLLVDRQFSEVLNRRISGVQGLWTMLIARVASPPELDEEYAEGTAMLATTPCASGRFACQSDFQSRCCRNVEVSGFCPEASLRGR
jgi:hypothetical protein